MVTPEHIVPEWYERVVCETFLCGAVLFT
jgi:hypothetical protein